MRKKHPGAMLAGGMALAALASAGAMRSIQIKEEPDDFKPDLESLEEARARRKQDREARRAEIEEKRANEARPYLEAAQARRERRWAKRAAIEARNRNRQK